MQVANHSVGFPATLKLNEIAVCCGAQWYSGATQMQGLAVNSTWFNDQGHVVLGHDHDDICMYCECDVFGMDKFGLMIAVVAAQASIGWTCALFVAL